MDTLARELRAQSHYWASKFDDAYELLVAVYAGQIKFAHPVASDCTSGAIRHYEEAAWAAREQLKFLASLPERQKT